MTRKLPVDLLEKKFRESIANVQLIRPDGSVRRNSPSWQKSKIAARILAKKASGLPLTARDKALSKVLKEDPAVTDRLIRQAYPFFLAKYQRLALRKKRPNLP